MFNALTTCFVESHGYKQGCTSSVQDPASEDFNVECPLCGKFFPKPVIEIHSSVCADDLIAFKSSSYRPNSLHSNVIVLD